MSKSLRSLCGAVCSSCALKNKRWLGMGTDVSRSNSFCKSSTVSVDWPLRMSWCLSEPCWISSLSIAVSIVLLKIFYRFKLNIVVNVLFKAFCLIRDKHFILYYEPARAAYYYNSLKNSPHIIGSRWLFWNVRILRLFQYISNNADHHGNRQSKYLFYQISLFWANWMQ